MREKKVIRLKPLPEPDERAKSIFRESVYQDHQDSSDEEASTDKLFVEKSTKVR